MVPELNSYLAAYGERFFRRRQRLAEDQAVFGRRLAALLGARSAVDFGCGIGTVLQGMREAGCAVLGVEPNAAAARKFSPVPELIIEGDVARPLNLGPFQWAVCLEVAEHIPPEFSRQVVDNCARHGTVGVVFSAARPGQRGTGHINCRAPGFWTGLFAEHGLRLDAEGSRQVRALAADTRLSWLVENGLVLRNNPAEGG